MDALETLKDLIPAPLFIALLVVTVAPLIGRPLYEFMRDVLPRFRRRLEERQRLELLKLRYEIEAIRRSNQIEVLEPLMLSTEGDSRGERVPLWGRASLALLGAGMPLFFLLKAAYSQRALGIDGHPLVYAWAAAALSVAVVGAICLCLRSRLWIEYVSYGAGVGLIFVAAAAGPSIQRLARQGIVNELGGRIRPITDGFDVDFSRDPFRSHPERDGPTPSFESIVAAVQQLGPVRGLDLSGIPISDLAPLSTARGLRTSLEQLIIADTQVRDLRPLSALHRLQTLQIEGTPVSDLSPLAALESLVDLFLVCSQVASLSPLVGLSHLRWVDVTGCPMSPDSILHFKRQRPDIQVVRMEHGLFSNDGDPCPGFRSKKWLR